ncbi:Rho GTPase-activating protein [Acrasis kona]|uniref:Rho GTPase-activating protein n=1 Tax=Acrasis kona TaxID=1008807 RepID=A0AAW2YP95_9EUKA
MGQLFGKHKKDRTKSSSAKKNARKTKTASVEVDTSNTRLFNTALEESTRRAHHKDEPNVPYPLYSAIKLLNARRLLEPGLYRVPGNKRIIEDYKNSFDRGVLIDFYEDCEKNETAHDTHDVCGIVTLFLNSLPESLFTAKLWDLFLLKQFDAKPSSPKTDTPPNGDLSLTEKDAQLELEKQQQQDATKELKIQRLQQLVWCELFPQTNRDTLRCFSHHLYMIDKNNAVNKMHAMNLVVSLFGASPFSRTYYLLITNYERIFTKPDNAPDNYGNDADGLSWLTNALNEQDQSVNNSNFDLNNRHSMMIAANRMSMSVENLVTKGSDIRKSRRNVRDRDTREHTPLTDTESVSIASPFSPSDEANTDKVILEETKP